MHTYIHTYVYMYTYTHTRANSAGGGGVGASDAAIVYRIAKEHVPDIAEH